MQVSRCTRLSESDHECPTLAGRSGTSSAVSHKGWDLGALVLVIIQRLTHYERVTSVARRVQTLH